MTSWAGNFGDRREQFPQIIHIELGRRIVQHQARRRPLRRLEGELTQDECSGQELLLTSGYAVPGGRSLEEERHVRGAPRRLSCAAAGPGRDSTSCAPKSWSAAHPRR